MQKNTIMIVDDEPYVLTSLHRALKGESWEVLTELSGEQALVRMRDTPVKVVISDERMAKMQGVEFLTIVRTLYPLTVRILLTGHASLEAAIELVNSAEIYRFFTKPWDIELLKEHIWAGLFKYDRDRKIMRIVARFGENPRLLPHIEEHYPHIGRIIGNQHYAIRVPVMNDTELEEVLHLLDSIEMQHHSA